MEELSLSTPSSPRFASPEKQNKIPLPLTTLSSARSTGSQKTQQQSGTERLRKNFGFARTNDLPEMQQSYSQLLAEERKEKQNLRKKVAKLESERNEIRKFLI